MWVKIDDKMHARRKTRRVLVSQPGKRRDAAPMGIWLLAEVGRHDAITESSDGGSIISLSGGNTIRCAASPKSFVDLMTNHGDK